MAYLNIYVTVKATVTYMLRYAILKKRLSPNLKLGNICEKLEKILGIFGKNRKKGRGEIVEKFGKFLENFGFF